MRGSKERVAGGLPVQLLRLNRNLKLLSLLLYSKSASNSR